MRLSIYDCIMSQKEPLKDTVMKWKTKIKDNCAEKHHLKDILKPGVIKRFHINSCNLILKKL
jgi:hypothetical protein